MKTLEGVRNNHFHEENGARPATNDNIIGGGMSLGSVRRRNDTSQEQIAEQAAVANAAREKSLNDRQVAASKALTPSDQREYWTPSQVVQTGWARYGMRLTNQSPSLYRAVNSLAACPVAPDAISIPFGIPCLGQSSSCHH